MRRFVQSVAALAVVTATASAQPALPPAPPQTSTGGWSVLAGYEVFSLSDGGAGWRRFRRTDVARVT
jgi:hypothetical protein